MFRLRCVNPCLRRLLHVGTVSRDQVLERLSVCSTEDQVFDVVGKNKAKLTVNHVSLAVGMLWQFQKHRTELLRFEEVFKSHPQFLTLRVLAENKIAHMDDFMLVDMLYNFSRLKVEPYDSLIQQLVSEAWLRIDRLPMGPLSKFCVCLTDQHCQQSPLMGRITGIVDQKLSSIDNFRILSTLMISTSSLVSRRMRDALISKANHLLDTADPSQYNDPRRVLQFLRNVKYVHRPLLDKCNQILLCNIPRMDIKHISIIVELYRSLQFSNYDFKMAVKQRLTELIDSSTDPLSFTKLFVVLAPMANPEIREGLESTALLLVDELNAHQAMALAEALEEIQSRNLSLLNKIASVIQRNLHLYKPPEVARITKALCTLQYQNPELLNKLRTVLVSFLQHSFTPYEVTMLTRSLSLLPCQRLEEAVTSRMEAVVTQCSLNDLNIISLAIAKWVRSDLSYRHNTPSKYVRLLQTLNRCAYERLQTADQLDLLMEDLKFISGEWFEEMLLEETIVTLQRMMDQINWAIVPELSLFLIRMSRLCPPMMDKIASAVVKDIDKITYSAIYATLLPFAHLNYDSAQASELFDVCIQCLIPDISSLEPHLLVLLMYTLAVVNRFPEEMVREIFSIGFLAKLDAQLESLPDVLNMRIRQRLMELNRAVCLECPEFQVPWFHESFCQQLQKRGNGIVSPVQQQIHKMLGEVFGGINCVQIAVVTPYFYTIDFECILDKNLQPLPYSNPSTLQFSDQGNVHWGRSSVEKDELPPGAQRVAIDFLGSKLFCKNPYHIKGEPLLRKRHLEILGYRVVQIPHFEWNSMELSTQDAWKEYLKNKIFRELSS